MGDAGGGARARGAAATAVADGRGGFAKPDKCCGDSHSGGGAELGGGAGGDGGVEEGSGGEGGDGGRQTGAAMTGRAARQCAADFTGGGEAAAVDEMSMAFWEPHSGGVMNAMHIAHATGAFVDDGLNDGV